MYFYSGKEGKTYRVDCGERGPYAYELSLIRQNATTTGVITLNDQVTEIEIPSEHGPVIWDIFNLIVGKGLEPECQPRECRLLETLVFSLIWWKEEHHFVPYLALTGENILSWQGCYNGADRLYCGNSRGTSVFHIVYGTSARSYSDDLANDIFRLYCFLESHKQHNLFNGLMRCIVSLE